VAGDASETGLVKFIQPLLMGGDLGCYNENGLEGLRQKYPMMKGVDGVDAMIPFSSDIKFNLIIRDMNTQVTRATKSEDNMCVFMKGAPERVLSRCNTVLIDG
jgi:magnesium-transporting ATPase (P-type)